MRSAHRRTFRKKQIITTEAGKENQRMHCIPQRYCLYRWIEAHRERKVNFFWCFVSTRLQYRCTEIIHFRWLALCHQIYFVGCCLLYTPITMDFWTHFKNTLSNTKFIRLLNSCNKCRCLHLLGYIPLKDGVDVYAKQKMKTSKQRITLKIVNNKNS